ncbi:MAG: hypothetical protein KJ072_06010 [Verrucomicrobia bacterium]|nr:hypothetical protein [Verrucomicrobiota bacterium]
MSGRRFNRASPGRVFAAVLALWVAIAGSAGAAQSFRDVRVAHQPAHDGDTYHGYREFRVLLENLSPSETREVTLFLPERSYGWGNNIRELRRTVVLSPGAEVAVSLWQPPLPIFGNGGMGVMVDGDTPGLISAPNAQRHLAPGGARAHYGAVAPVTFLVSRSLDHAEVSRSLHGVGGLPLSAEKATGAADVGGHFGVHANAWMPDPSHPGPHWIEFTFATPLPVNLVQVYETSRTMGGSGAALVLGGVSGTNLAIVPIPSAGRSSTVHAAVPITVAVPLTVEPVRTVRLEFGPTPSRAICIDALAVEGPAGRAWASGAKASSDASGVAGSFVGTVEGHRQFLRAELPVTEWSETWLSYTPYDAIVLGRTDQSLLPAPVAAALRSYVEAGGNLILFGDPEARKRWRGIHETVIVDGHRLNLGFGCCFVIPGEKPSDLKSAAVRTLIEAADLSARYWHLLPRDEGANGAFPVVENVAIPVRGIVLVMLLFILLIGPVNLVVLSRLKRRIWMLWTIPAISLATCGLVFVYSFVREGFTPDTRLESLTVLDQGNRRATTIGAVALYCPLTPNQGLQFSADTEVTPLVQSWDARSGTPREIDWSQSQHLRRGWVTARVPTHLQLRKSEVRRERLQLSRAEGGFEVVNGLGAGVVSLLLAGPDGRLHQADRIAAGQKSVLVPAAEARVPGRGLGPRPLFLETGYAGQSSQLETNAAGYLLPGTYLAELDGSPFLESGLGDGPARSRTRVFVYGILDSPATP